MLKGAMAVHEKRGSSGHVRLLRQRGQKSSFRGPLFFCFFSFGEAKEKKGKSRCVIV
jgi:hypothetical protein